MICELLRSEYRKSSHKLKETLLVQRKKMFIVYKLPVNEMRQRACPTIVFA